MIGWMDGRWMDRWMMDGWMDGGWMVDGWMDDGLMDGWMMDGSDQPFMSEILAHGVVDRGARQLQGEGHHQK